MDSHHAPYASVATKNRIRSFETVQDHHPANRIELSRGRDLVVEPGPAGGPINFLAHPVLEVEGKPVKIKASFSFRREHPVAAAGEAISDSGASRSVAGPDVLAVIEHMGIRRR